MADYNIYEVRYDSAHTHIDSVKAIPELGEEIVFKREEVIAKIKEAVSFITFVKGTTGWKKGEVVKIIVVKNVEYIKTLPDETTSDNLGELPEF